ncbi:sulfotransferase family protein [Aestuariibius insulae]|uniref:sulfotransferase family protein n=1 Tax=Aestuariibius insulae TaxID=2058287 RepID=UPI00345EFE91
MPTTFAWTGFVGDHHGMPHRYVFVGGLHRSGTSLVARLIGSLPNVGAITNAPVPENEGVYLQGAIPHTARHGRPDHFATDPDQHHIEGSRYDTLEVRTRIEADWSPWFPNKAAWRVEKSPVNLMRMRLYQQLWPMAQFVIVVRHPAFWIRAIGKWSDRHPEELADYWAGAYGLALADREALHSSLILRYEDVVADPQKVLDALGCFLDLGDVPRVCEHVRDGNADYSPETGAISAPGVAAVMDRLGYTSLTDLAQMKVPRVTHPLRVIKDATRQVFDE